MLEHAKFATKATLCLVAATVAIWGLWDAYVFWKFGAVATESSRIGRWIGSPIGGLFCFGGWGFLWIHFLAMTPKSDDYCLLLLGLCLPLLPLAWYVTR